MLWINQAKTVKDKIVGVSWIGLDRPVANCLMPLYCKMTELPPAIQTMNLLEFQFNGDSAWWAFNFVANYTNLNYSYMMKDLVLLQKNLEFKAAEKINQALTDGDTHKLNEFCLSHAEEVLTAWWKLATQLIIRYNDGCITTDPNNVMAKIDYPKPWLELVGFYNGPTKY